MCCPRKIWLRNRQTKTREWNIHLNKETLQTNIQPELAFINPLLLLYKNKNRKIFVPTEIIGSNIRQRSPLQLPYCNIWITHLSLSSYTLHTPVPIQMCRSCVESTVRLGAQGGRALQPAVGIKHRRNMITAWVGVTGVQRVPSRNGEGALRGDLRWGSGSDGWMTRECRK